MNSPLISVDALKPMLKSADLRLIDCRFDLGNTEAGRTAWSKGHIPGAFYAHLDEDLSGAANLRLGRHPLPDASDFSQRLDRWGLQRGHRVVVYDDASGAMASRLWWLLRWAGFERVHVLDGGMKAWVAGRGILSVATRSRPPQQKTNPIRWPRGWTIEAAELSAGLAGGDLMLIDARPGVRFRGEEDPIDPVKGHVPGAVNWPFSNNLDDQGRFRPLSELREDYEVLLGSCASRRVVHMCGSGVTACHNLLVMEALGLHGSRLYAPSWSGWISDDRRPVETGDPAASRG